MTTTNRLIVVPDPAEQVSRGGIVIPDVASEAPSTGRVVAVGDAVVEATGQTLPSPQFARGDRVVYAKYGGTTITVDGTDVLILAHRDVLAVLDD